jgi:hypothetical protein
MFDADEIPSREVVEALQWCDFPQTLIPLPMTMYYYSLGCLVPEPWYAAVACTAGFFRQFTVTKKPKRDTSSTKGSKRKHKRGTKYYTLINENYYNEN